MSSDTSSHQTPINGTISYIVPPGSQTNRYYILISNLPFQSNWRQIKDFVRTVCPSVERVQVFPGSTSGWVCVEGREGFDATMKLFANRNFNSRAIFADGRNADKHTVIKDSEGAPHYARMMDNLHNTSAAMVSGVSELTQWSSTMTPTSGSIPPTMSEYRPVPPYVHGDITSWWSSKLVAPGSYAEQPSYSSVAVPEQYAYSPGYQSPQQYQMDSTQSGGYPYAHTYTKPYPGYAAPASGSYATPSPAISTIHGDSVVKIKMRKIIIKHLPTWVTAEQLQGLVQKKTSIGADQIHDIYLTQPAGSSGINKGSACVTLDSEDTASRVIRKLNGYKYGHYNLQVELTKEGVSTNEGHSDQHHRSSRSGGKDRDRKESHHSTSEGDKKSHGGGKHRSSSHHHKPEIVVAHGSRRQDSKDSSKNQGSKY